MTVKISIKFIGQEFFLKLPLKCGMVYLRMFLVFKCSAYVDGVCVGVYFNHRNSIIQMWRIRCILVMRLLLLLLS